MHCSKTQDLQGDRSSVLQMRLAFGKYSKNFYVFSNNDIFIQYQHNQQSHISYDVIPSILPNTANILPCMTLVVTVTTLLTYM